MFDKRVEDLLAAMTKEERLMFDFNIIARFNGTERAEEWLFEKRLKEARGERKDNE